MGIPGNDLPELLVHDSSFAWSIRLLRILALAKGAVDVLCVWERGTGCAGKRCQ